MKKIITLVIISALVLAAFSVLPMQSVKAATSDVNVLSYSWYVAPSNTVLASAPGDLIVAGEIENVGKQNLENVTLQGIAFSSTGAELATTYTQAFVHYTPPGQKAPFYLDFNAASSTTDNLSWIPSVSYVIVTVTLVIDTKDTQYSGLTIPPLDEDGSYPYIPGNGSYIVVGTIVNTGTQVAQDPWVVATFYNSSGTVIGLDFSDYLTSSLAPGGAWHFFASPADDTPQLTSEIANYSITVDSLTLSNGATSSPTGSISTTQFPTLPIVVAVVVIVVVIVAALMLLRKRQKTPPPPPPPPPPMP